MNMIMTFVPAFCFSQSSGSTESETISISIADAISLESSDIFNSIEILPLEFNTSAIIQNIEKVNKCNDRLYVLNRMNSTANIVVFNLDGTFSNVLDRRGKGPGEFVQIFDFDVDPISNNIWISDGLQSRMNIYDEKLHFIREHRFEKGKQANLLCFQKSDPKWIVFTKGFNRDDPNDKNQIMVGNNDGNIYNEYLPVKKRPGSSYGRRFRLQPTSNSVAYFPAFSDYIYYINQDTCFIAYNIDFDRDCIKQGTRITSSAHSGEVFSQSIVDSDVLLLVFYMYNSKVYFSFYNKLTKQITTVTNPWNSITNSGYLLDPIGSIDNKLVFVASNMDIHEILSKIDKGGSKLSNSEALKKIDPASELSNPILIFAEL